MWFFDWIASWFYHSPPPPDTRKEYRVRCPDCYTVTGQRFNQPLTENEAVCIILCVECGRENRITIPIAPEEKLDDDAPK